MCGIAGYWNYGSGRTAAGEVLEAMVASLRHRGPDDEGYFVDGSLALGIRRLQVVDPSGGRQPVFNEDGTVAAIFNGEIYNHADLRRELSARGHRFRSRCDSEAIVHAFEEWGTGCVGRFNGMFAFAVWDARHRRLFLARDRLGIKPLYVYEGPQGVAFASELKALLAAPWVPVGWDLEALEDYLTYEYVPAPRSIVQGVEKLPAATWALYAPGSATAVQRRQYWALEASDPPGSVAEAERELRDRLTRAVERRMVADVPVGAFLSGGIDSSIIVGLMSAAAPDSVRSFSIGFDDSSYDETRYARLVARRFGTVHRENRVTSGITDLADRLADHFDEPFGDVSAFPTYHLSRVTREEVTVALSGDGGDELFAGYDAYRAHRWAARLAWLRGDRGLEELGGLLNRVPPGGRKKGPVNKAKRFVEGFRYPADLEHARWWTFFGPDEREGLYVPALRAELGTRDCFDFYRGRLAAAAEAGFTGLQRQLHADVTGYLADDILVKLDRMSMAVSLEARVPFLDHEVVEYAMRIPADWKIRKGATKWILKRAFRDVLPPAVLRRAKEGFSMPIKNWLRGPLRPLLHDLTSAERVTSRGWFRHDAVKRLVAEHLAGTHNHAHRLWCLVSLELSLDGLERRVSLRRGALAGSAP